MKRIYLLLFSAACLLLGSCTSYQTGASYKRHGSGYNTRYGYSDPWEVGSVSPYYRPSRPYQNSFFGFGSYHGHHHHQARHENHQRSSPGGSKDKRPPVSTLRERGSASSHSSGPDKSSGQSRPPTVNSSKASRPSGGSTLRERGSGSSRGSSSSKSSEQSRLPSRNSSKASRSSGGSTLQERGSGSSRSSSSSKGKGSSLRSRG